MLGFCRTLTCPNSAFAIFQGAGGRPATNAHLHWTETLNGREWATVIWLGLALTFILARSDIRPSALNVIRSVCNKTILVPVAIMLGYIATVVFVASQIGLWNVRLLGATLAWIAVSALAGFFRVTAIPKDRHYFRTAARRAVRITVLVDAYVNVFVFPFAIELVLLPLLILLAMLMAVAEASDELKGAEYDTTRSCLKSLLGIIGLGLFAYATIHIIGEILGTEGLSRLGKSVVLPVWLNIALIPFMYLLAIWVVYETTFASLGFPANATRASLHRSKLALLLSVGPRAYALGDFGPPWPYRLNAAPTLADARRVATELRAGRKRAADQQE